MLQYIITSGDSDKIVNQTKQVLDGGCRWIEIKAPKEMDDIKLGEVIDEVLPLIREKEATLIIASRITLAKEKGADGVHLYENDMPPTTARMELEAGPIIGISVKSVNTVESNLYFDIDYFRFEPLFEEDKENLKTLEEISRFLREKKSDKPLAAAGGISKNNLYGVLAAGAEGIAVDETISNENDSLAASISCLINELGKS